MSPVFLEYKKPKKRYGHIFSRCRVQRGLIYEEKVDGKKKKKLRVLSFLSNKVCPKVIFPLQSSGPPISDREMGFSKKILFIRGL